MPIPNYPPEEIHRWHDSTTGVAGSTANSLRYHRYGRGQRRTTEDPPGLPLVYAGFRSYADVIRAASPLISTYYPSSDESQYVADVYQGLYVREVALAQNKSWSKLMERVKGDSSALAVTAAEGREAFEMISKRTLGLFRAYRALRKGDFRRFLRELSVDPKRKHRSKIRTVADEASGLWLEYWFGWSPTVQEIGSTVYVLTSKPIIAEIRERGVAKFKLPSLTRTVGNLQRRVITEAGHGFVKQGGQFKVSNENLFLANRLGLVNPALVAWELVPFSFVVDWFTKFGDVLESWTDLAGISTHNEWGVTYCKVRTEASYFRTSAPQNRCMISGNSYATRRIKGFYKPVPIHPVIANFGDSLTRAATAVSLLNQVFLAK